jgi:GntR family transcriptional regulator
MIRRDNLDKIDKTIPTPLYYQLLQILKGKIESGVWKIGDTIPTENELIQEYDISRTTVRQAMLALVNDGYLRREKSKGTIVTSPTGRMRFVGSLMSFTEEMEYRGVHVTTRNLEQKVVPADATIAQKLNIPEGADVFYLKRIRYVKDVPYLLDEHFITYALCPGIENKYRDNTSLYHLLEKDYHFNLHHGQIEFEPIRPLNKEMINLLEIYSTTTLIYADRIVYSDKGVAMDYFKSYIHGKFAIDVVKSSDGMGNGGK